MKTILRCAVYTRKSSEEGLDQAFNSLDAQREACDAYIKSQKNEGWRGLATRYDDGGYSGGSMDRPGLKRLLDDIDAGKIDVIVVYKIDRLTRSLADFARMVELFDRHQVSFVSVTQAFNTTSSMGRLTLNVLLSFAQFEREVTGERIRDKISASKQKGMWMGGNVPLGYDIPKNTGRALVVNQTEAKVVNTIFAKYLELGSVRLLQRWLDAQDIRSKQWTTREGRTAGGKPFSRGALFHLLRNRTYLGRIVHKRETHPGLHPPIIEAELFDAVQAKLDTGVRRHEARCEPSDRAPLKGRIFDGDGQPMTPSFTYGKRGQVYRYYVSAPLQQGRRKPDHTGIRRVPGTALEALISKVIRRIAPSIKDPLSLPGRIEVQAEALHLLMPIGLLAAARSKLIEGEVAEPEAADSSLMRLTLPVRLRLRGGRTWVLGNTPPPSRRDPTLIKALRRAHAMLNTDPSGLPSLNASPPSPYLRRLVRLALLAPDLQRAILEGRQPPGVTLERLMRSSIPLLWSEQIALFDSLAISASPGSRYRQRR